MTGAAAGIGRATVLRLVAAGYPVAACDVDAAALDALPSQVMTEQVDVSDGDRLTAYVRAVEERTGGVGVLVNNAGVMTVAPFLERRPEVVRREWEVNYMGVVNGMRAVLPAMLDRGAGHIVNVASAAALVGIPGESTYSATKHAVLGLTEAVRGELGGTGVRFTVVLPAVTRTRLAAGTRPSRGIRALEPEDVARAIVAAIERPRFEVFVPPSLRLALKLGGVAPRPARDLLARWSGTDRVALDADREARAGYEAQLVRQARGER